MKEHFARILTFASTHNATVFPAFNAILVWTFAVALLSTFPVNFLATSTKATVTAKAVVITITLSCLFDTMFLLAALASATTAIFLQTLIIVFQFCQ